MFFFSKKPTICVLTPFVDQNNSPIYPKIKYSPGKKWTYYDLCLQKVASVKYLPLESFSRASGYDYVFVHETFYDAYPHSFLAELQKIKRKNGKLYWFELHEKSLYSEGIFTEGFFETIDRLYKHQILDFKILKEECGKEFPHIAPYQLFGHMYPLPYFKTWFGFSFSDAIFEKHRLFPFENYRNKIYPLMFPFSYQMIERGFPTYKTTLKKHKIGYSGRSGTPAHTHRNLFVSALKKQDFPIYEDEKNYLKTLAESETFLALGHIHSSLRTFDTLAFDTVLAHYDIAPYTLWPEFKEMQTLLPIGNVHNLFGPGGLSFNPQTIVTSSEKLHINSPLKKRLLENQKALFEKLITPAFIASKVGVNEK